MLPRLVVFLAVGALISAQQPAGRGRRLALVIANGDYQNLPDLSTPANEAQLMADALTAAGFEVQLVRNMHFPDFLTTTEKPFLNKIRAGDTVVFYYSGYAVQGEDDNYLLPVDFLPGSKVDLQDRSYHLSRMQQGLDDAAAGLKIFVLESARSIATPVAGVATPGMMAQPEVPKNALFAFAASPGQTVPATGADVSRFTLAVAQSMKTPGRRLLDVFGAAKREVANSSAGQTPSIQENILNPDFFFIYPALTVSPPSLTFSSPLGPLSQSLSVYAGDYAGRFNVSPPDAKWLTVSPESGVTPGSGTPTTNVKVSVSPRGLGPGSYESRITISAPDSDMTSSPQVTVSYAILPETKQPPIPRPNKKDREEYLLIPSGQFKMGCVPADKLCREDEKPQHPVALTRNFWIGRNEIQVDSYKRFVELLKKKMPPGPLWDTRWQHGNLPVVNVTWDNARDYCAWAGGRLPTEAEWEYAARAGSEDEVYPLNDENSRDKANFYGKKGNDIYDEPAPVRKFDPSSFGLYDMAGNVWEWVSDFYASDYYSHSAAIDPKGPLDGRQHIRRGGSFDSDPKKHLRLSIRDEFGKAENALGFRCVLDDTPDTHKNLGVE
jgi:sulfatase modifying factor 1